MDMIHNKTIKAAIFIAAIIFVLRLPAFWAPILDVDEAQFAGFADALLAGGAPYIASLDTKPLGIYWFYEAVFYLFGRNNMIAVHVVTALWVGATALFCYRIARRLYSARAGFWAALFYAVFTTAFVPKFIGTSITVVMMLPLAASIDELLAWEQDGRQRHVWLSGILWGIACLFKYQAGINLIAVGFYLLIFRPLYLDRSLLRMRLGPFISFLLGGAIVGALFALYLKAAGAWDAFVFWSIKGSAAYVEAAAGHIQFWKALATHGLPVVAAGFLLWWFAAAKSAHLLRDLSRPSRHRRQRCEEYLVLIWLCFSFVPVCMGGKFYGHYFLQLYPALSILAAGETMRLIGEPSHSARQKSRRLAWTLIIAGLVVPALGFFGARLAADRIYAAIGEENPRQYIPIAEYIRARTGNEERIFIWGFATPIYIYADRPAASRFLWCDWLTGRISGTPSARDASFDTTPYITRGSWEMFFEDMERSKPKYFVDTSPGNHHDYGKYPVSRYPLLKEFLDRNYALEATVNGADIYGRRAR
ncbi:MAG: glycosyltransferase family 39 protein [bacterium]